MVRNFSSKERIFKIINLNLYLVLGFVGWQTKSPSYKQWEESMKYISPIYDMPGEKITATPYNAIIIG